MGLRHELRAERFDVCVDMQGSIRSGVVGWMAGAGRRVGMEEPRESPAAWLYGEQVKVTAAHVVEQGCELLGAAVGAVLRPGKAALPMDGAAEVWCDSLLDHLVSGGRFVVLAPTAGWGAKEWPAERYGAAAAALGKAGFRVLVNAAPSGDAVAEAVVRASEGAAVAVPCSVGEMIALVRRADLVMGGDTGPLHLAAALERPVVGIYGPTDPARTGPYGAGVGFPGRVLRNASSVTDHSRFRVAEAGLLRIGVDEVVGTVLEVLREA
jgi:heptosyltransferase-1